MKSSNKSSIITGTILLSLAAVFSICLILQVLDFGVGGPGHNNIFYFTGNMLTTVYGFSSILIPVFLLISGLYCFAAIWTAQKTMRLITALIPFYTCVLTEKICRSVLSSDSGSSAIIKAVIAGVTGLMLLIIEIIGAGIIADSVNRKIFYKGKPVPKPVEPENNEEYYDESDDYDEAYDETDVETEETEDGQFKYEKIKPKKTIFDKAFKKLKDKKKDESFEALIEEADELYESDIPSIEDYEALGKGGEVAAENVAAGDTIAAGDAVAAAPSDNIEHKLETHFADEPVGLDSIDTSDLKDVFDEPDAPAAEEPEEEKKNPASIISQEEYAALLAEEEIPAEENAVDELEWNNLPPVPAQLPDDYIEEEIDTDDPALQFPPAEEAASKEAAAAEEASSPYAAAKYIDTVVPNPAYSSGISIRNGEEAEEEKQEPKVEPVKSKYPRKISLGADTTNQAEQKKDELDPDFFDIDMNNVEGDEELSDDIEPVPEELEVGNSVFQQIAKQENSVSFGKVGANVFSDMEKDIRNKAKDDDDYGGVFDDDESVFSKDLDLEMEEEESPELNPNAGHANNLTADELTDFFNAQQEENTPQHKVIEGPAPKSHKATKKGPYVIPSNLLTAYKDDQYWIIDDETKQASINLKQTLSEFNIDADIIGIKKGPVVTMFEILPAPGVKLSKIVALQDNIALSLAAQSVRIVAPIPGKQAVGIEVPNKRRSVVGFREIIEMDLPEWNKMAVPVVLGKDILGKAQLIDLVKTPHMLIAGATGSGKSVCVNSLILSILYKRSFKDVKMILVDPKVVELKLYNNIPHLLTPVITEPKKAIQALQYCLCEMERRYALLDGLGVRDISSYNERIKERDICTEKLPYIVVIIDEFADLMATSGKELENIVARLTAMSRAVGIHLVLATQRPSTNVITGLIKANIPSRIAFMVASRIDSQIIIDGVGAEKLLGRGDMLYASAVDPAPIRIQGTYVDDNEVEKVVECVKQYGEPDYIDDEIFVEDDEDEGGNVDLFGNNMDEDPLYDQALEIVVQSGKASASYIQRRLKIGYNRAARLVEEMEERGIVGPANGSKPREIIHIPG